MTLTNLGHLTDETAFDPTTGILCTLKLTPYTSAFGYIRLPRTNPFNITQRYTPTASNAKVSVRTGSIMFTFNVSEHPALREQLIHYWKHGKTKPPQQPQHSGT